MKLMKMLRNNEEERESKKKEKAVRRAKKGTCKLNQNRAISFSQLIMLVERTSIASVLNASS